MAQQQVALALEPRTVHGKQVRRLRQQGLAPVHLYGPGIESQSLQGGTQDVIRVLAQAGRNTPVMVRVRGYASPYLALVRDVMWDPFKGDLLHVDLLRVEADQPVSAEVPVALTGESAGARDAGGTVMQVLHSVQVEARPMDIPHELDADTSIMDAPDSALRAADLPLPPGVTLLTDPETMVARIEVTRREAVAAEAAEAPVVEEPAEAQPKPTGEEDSESGESS